MKKRLQLFLPYILFFALTFIIFKPYFLNNKIPFPSNLLVSYFEPFISYPSADYPSGPPNKPIGFDSLRIYYPLRELTIASFQHFSWPLWNPYDFSGNTQLATYQSAVFHPLSILFFLLPHIDAWAISVILAPSLGMIFMYLFLRELQLSRSASVFGALGFGLSGFVITNTEELFLGLYSALFLPFILYGIIRIYKKISRVNFLCITLGTAFSILSGWFQMTFYSLIFALIYSIFLFFTYRNKKTFVLVLFALFLGVCLSAIHLIPGFEAYFYSARGAADVKFLFTMYLVPWSHLITLVAPDYFGSPAAYNYFGKGFYFEQVLFVALPVLLFAIYAVFMDFRRKKEVSFLTLAWLITLSLGFSLPTSWFILYTLHLPFVSTQIPSRIFFLSAVCVCILAAYGVDSYRKKISWIHMLLSVGLIGLILAGGWGYIAFVKLYLAKKLTDSFSIIGILHNTQVSLRNMIVPTILFFLTAFVSVLAIFKRVRPYTHYAFLLLSIVSSIYFAQKYFYFSERRFVFPQVPVLQKLEKLSGNDRVWSFGPAYIDRNFLTYYHLQSPEGYDSIAIQRYLELLTASARKGNYSPQTISRADGVLLSGQTTSEITENSLRLKLLSLLGVKYIVGANTPHSDLEKDHTLLIPIWHDSKFIIYHYQKAYPRTFLVDDYTVIKDNQSILDFLFSPHIDLERKVTVEQPINLPKNTGSQLVGKSDIISYTPNRVVIKARVNKPAVLFLSDNYYPGWQARIDGKQTPMYRTDYSFRSVVVPSGTHIVTFFYQPMSFLIGLLLSCASIGVLLAISLFFDVS